MTFHAPFSYFMGAAPGKKQSFQPVRSLGRQTIPDSAGELDPMAMPPHVLFLSCTTSSWKPCVRSWVSRSNIPLVFLIVFLDEVLEWEEKSNNTPRMYTNMPIKRNCFSFWSRLFHHMILWKARERMPIKEIQLFLVVCSWNFKVTWSLSDNSKKGFTFLDPNDLGYHTCQVLWAFCINIKVWMMSVHLIRQFSVSVKILLNECWHMTQRS